MWEEVKCCPGQQLLCAGSPWEAGAALWKEHVSALEFGVSGRGRWAGKQSRPELVSPDNPFSRALPVSR